MLHIRQVVHPTDFSDGARAAFAHALHLARHHGATLDVVHAAPLLGDLPLGPDPGMAFYPEGYEDQYFVDQKTALLAYVQGADTTGVTLNVVPPIFGGPTAREILRHALHVQADLIVMGTHGRHGVKRLLLGSVAEAVVRRSQCPVLTVQARPDGGAFPHTVRRIVAAVDLGYNPEELVRYAGELATLYPASVVLLHVVDGVTPADVGPLGAEWHGQRLADLEAQALHLLEQLRQRLIDPALAVSCHVSSGFTLDAVPAAIRHLAPDLVITASHGFSGFDRLLMGSISEQIIRQGHQATFVFKPVGKSLLTPLPSLPIEAHATV